MDPNKNKSEEKDKILKKDFQFARYVYLSLYAVLVISRLITRTAYKERYTYLAN